MLNMSRINNIRDLRRRGYRISEIARELCIDRKTVRKYIKEDDFSPSPLHRSLIRTSRSFQSGSKRTRNTGASSTTPLKEYTKGSLMRKASQEVTQWSRGT